MEGDEGAGVSEGRAETVRKAGEMKAKKGEKEVRERGVRVC